MKKLSISPTADIVTTLMEKGAGARFTQTIASMYDKTVYTPKINSKKFGKSIISMHGVIHGRKTSSNLFSFTMSEIHKSLSFNTTYLKDISLLQLADDTALLAETAESLCNLFKQVLRYSGKKYMVANLSKTFYMEMTCNPLKAPLRIDDITSINSAENGRYHYLGMLFTHINDIVDLIDANLNHRAFNIRKYID